MTSLLALLALLAWAAGVVVLADAFRRLLAHDPVLRLVCQLRPGAVALYLAVVIVAWPAAVAAKALSDLVDRGRG
ncbi:hypothetical protein [Streptomyces sp. NBC_00140]|uniref:hypothetical protein n=1 Tax=Streptomyces sp. NBC_00140 TaxID=2975664 RepID=UPI00225094A9|nr:hypothetical protein [Streptomyces sp. NBC_00140]MCX5328100.1 hypothetical protein [Streptomyces sp. NBC_00140]